MDRAKIVVPRSVSRGGYYFHTVMFLKRVLFYLNPATLFAKHDPTPDGAPGNVNLRFMHGINRISILMFLACLLVMVLRACFR